MSEDELSKSFLYNGRRREERRGKGMKIRTLKDPFTRLSKEDGRNDGSLKHSWWPDGYFCPRKKKKKKREDEEHAEAKDMVTASRSGGCWESSPRSRVSSSTFNAICHPLRTVRHPEPPPRVPTDPTGPTIGDGQLSSRCGRGTNGQRMMGHVNREWTRR